ncbi:hypothetical protein KV102_09785 [Mumia sp. zg.B53]|nr:hypothetical protein [Mumia sp. zg.B53]MBW9215129.1 hypothetical protein [Mumia sp. zg.B53]
MSRGRVVVPAVALAVAMSGCGGDPYVAVEEGFRDWLLAVDQRDEAA